ncbi:Oidioi.mRNA.OKI2018_I69.YSR.g17062.t1.cds [Oikopleura dioica]|uniref:Oidioi.mRNA.OKI2018_I69.YSR.g17062.t1.cds n=1 Tax=Oikopleura dioica TaxID=34765 RepID=A0ABN7SI24_OIKDI|nr:Oidioi.mRNA.OKI2018_I69.YSR.g17062.t1.cds [Oikopleura dioica]
MDLSKNGYSNSYDDIAKSYGFQLMYAGENMPKAPISSVNLLIVGFRQKNEGLIKTIMSSVDGLDLQLPFSEELASKFNKVEVLRYGRKLAGDIGIAHFDPKLRNTTFASLASKFIS